MRSKILKKNVVLNNATEGFGSFDTFNLLFARIWFSVGHPEQNRIRESSTRFRHLGPEPILKVLGIDIQKVAILSIFYQNLLQILQHFRRFC